MDIRGKTAIVTGASRGIGKQVAIELGRRGANVVVAARTVEPHRRLGGTIGETVKAVEAAGGQALAVRADVSEVADLEALAAAAVERFGGVNVLVNNAADTSGGTPSVLDLDRADWLRQFDANLHGPFSLIQAVLPSMRERGGGVIVNLTSGAGDMAPAVSPPAAGAAVLAGERIAYAASKAALNRLGNVIAPELRELGVAVVAVDPGFTRTELVELMGERGAVDPDAAIPMDVPVKAVVHVITCDDPMRYTGTILRAAEFVQENRL
ncbi:MAG TPA: SDR family oxidoreductase [Acidimicrobiales bacterium]|nr:SDR family oxidoreductase [Acidimicrobiales bacterium]